MDKSDLINSFAKIFILNLFTYYMFSIISGYKQYVPKKMILIFLSNILVSMLYIMFIHSINQIFIIPLIYINYTIIIKRTLKQGINYSFFVSVISFLITYIVYIISILISGIILSVIYPSIEYNNFINIFSIFLIMSTIYYGLCKMKRLKNGINFLRDFQNIGKISFVTNIISIMILAIFMSPNDLDSIELYTFMALVVILLSVVVLYWIRSKITEYYKKSMKDKTIEIQKLEIDEKERIIEDIKNENLKLAEAVHKYNNRFSAIETALEEIINKNMNTEYSNELSNILCETKEISKKFAKEVTITNKSLPSTNIYGIDNMIKHMQKEAIKNDINFDFKLNDNIHDLIENIVSKDKFETIIGDHLKNAIVAINYSNSKYRSILVTLGIVENYYELSIYDTGIEFEIETLLQLGEKRQTTHKEKGGSGIGFMTTFETLREIKASLIIEEYNSINSSYTKSINIRFDGENQYIISSYRAQKIKDKDKNGKIIIKNI